MAVMRTQLDYDAGGLAMRGDLYRDDALAAPRAAILVYPDALGIGSHPRRSAERLAALGYVALACDLHGAGERFTGADVAPRIGEVFGVTDVTRTRARAALDLLLAQPGVDPQRVAAIGYCYGGTMAFELARSGAPLAAAVGFHAGLTTKRPEDAKNISGKILACIGAEDAHVPPADRAAFEDEMRAGGVDWRLHLYGGVVHSFTDPDAAALGRPDFARYDAGADKRSWNEMLALFDEVFG